MVLGLRTWLSSVHPDLSPQTMLPFSVMEAYSLCIHRLHVEQMKFVWRTQDWNICNLQCLHWEADVLMDQKTVEGNRQCALKAARHGFLPRNSVERGKSCYFQFWVCTVAQHWVNLSWAKNNRQKQALSGYRLYWLNAPGWLAVLQVPLWKGFCWSVGSL